VAADRLEDQARLGVPAIIIAGLALAAGLSATTGTYDSGIRFEVQDGTVVVAEVEHHSQAERDGVHPGLVAISHNRRQQKQHPHPR
jgi:predicted metalloprotease with PDZ domain